MRSSLFKEFYFLAYIVKDSLAELFTLQIFFFIYCSKNSLAHLFRRFCTCKIVKGLVKIRWLWSSEDFVLLKYIFKDSLAELSSSSKVIK